MDNLKNENPESIGNVILESGFEVKSVYRREDVLIGYPEIDEEEPGKYPFTRGIHPLMYRKQPFTIRQYAGFASPEETNKRFKFLIRNGQNGLNVAFDLPTQCGLDSDDPRSLGEVGRVGMSVDTLEDFEIAFNGIDLDKITVSLTINGAALVIMAMYFAMAEKRGYDLSKLRGTSQNDILKEFIGRGTWIFPVDSSVKLVVDTIEYCARNIPKYSPVSVCGYHIRESGANPVQEMAYAFCIAKAYSDETIKRGLGIDEFASRLSYNFDIYGNFFEQIAKFRGGRRLWAKIMREQYGALNDRSCWMRMIAGGGGAGLTKEQPENNIVRTAYYALISALSGTQTMALCTYDEAFTIPTEKAAEIALRTMQILTHEMGICDTVDPLGGSYYIETLTNRFENEIQKEMKKVDGWGGIVNAIATGKIQEAISQQAYIKETAIQNGKIKKVGVNCFKKTEEKRTVEFHPYNNDAANKQINKLRSLKSKRDQAPVNATLERLRQDAKNNENLMPAAIEAVKAYASVGEIIEVLKDVYGEYQEPIFF
ncbi:methylmalonyl-CoA mutase [Ignavibacteria bacterium CHB1]|jgi:methylmalonyl-CoA mutase (EC 5.4.99.2)|nr:MAG: methylmalonyl-CoA mutase [Chlorobiota bacterium]KXK04911.1 MAG: methylmalonyl-CoA mutase [Chlorobi bacterium OLB4]MBV6397728.1 Methylmalonyl-CoA mutase [Ignavibacteria bacterium]MCC6885508.1 methylmalonyl-CoA mutase [Ignavibacteriales bacterium]MCE7952860.1 methylmalonyl-CoA mutase [Chlorobi bacterium CHB7]MDL1886973.1 methylmalonyl-CoA mutase [Ignavibacteria bacterium CHB1]OQY79095.1 MAG: methylmalonyl-CoA mutase [Ignavibacteriales bacterium UTCHB1]RIK49618.1 MAG: methylmalonyl-CoA 